MSRLLPGLAAVRGACAAPRLRPVCASVLPMARASFSTSPKAPASAAAPLPTTRLLTPESLRAMWATQPSLTPLSSSSTATSKRTAFPATLATSLLRRAFSSSPTTRIRDQYYRRQSWEPAPPPPNFWQRLKGRVNRWDPVKVVYALIAINIGVFLMWQYAISSAQRFRDVKLYNFMWKNFILSEINIRAGRLWTLFTSAFSHTSGAHIFFNCLGLYFMAPAVATMLGAFNFLGLYLGGGLFGALCSLAYQHVNSRGRVAGSEGASAAIYACLAFFGTIFPQSTFLLFFVVPMPAWLLVGGLFGWDFYQAITGSQGMTDSAGHAGGIAFGVASALYARRKLMRGFGGRFR